MCDVYVKSLIHASRYQPGTLNSPSQLEKLMEESEKMPVSGGESGDEYDMEMDQRPLKETFSFKMLFCPSGKIPTVLSGNIVYATTAVICKCVSEKAKTIKCDEIYAFLWSFRVVSNPLCSVHECDPNLLPNRTPHSHICFVFSMREGATDI